MLPAPALIAVAMLLALIVLIPCRRLQLAGLSSRAIGFYGLCLWGLAMVLAIRPLAGRFLVPIVLVMYLAPFVVAPDRVAGIVRRTRGRHDDPPRPPIQDGKPPIKNVTPPDGPTGPE